jgi:hypothetical protein
MFSETLCETSGADNIVRTGRDFLAIAVSLLFLISGMVPVQATGLKPRLSRHTLRKAHARLVKSRVSLGAAAVAADVAPAFDPPEQTIGERFFLETRFAQYFATHINGTANNPLVQSDPTVIYVQLGTSKVLGPFAGKSMNCGSCHFVDDVDAGNRTYAEFSVAIPNRCCR